MPQIRVHLLPGLIPADCDLSGSCCVVIDVLRATTSMVMAFEAGAVSIRPFESIDEAKEFADANSYLLAGERKGLKIDGFDFGNSPLEFRPEKVDGRRLAMTTTNGTRALLACHSASKVIVAAFTNLAAVCESLSSQPQIDIVCAGTNGETTEEDTLLAGAIASRFARSDLGNRHASEAVELWHLHKPDLQSALIESQGGKNLVGINRQDDIRFAGQVDISGTVPFLLGNEIVQKE